MKGETAAPVAREERVQTLDILRGFALLGVFIANIVGFGHSPQLATDAQVAAMPSAQLDGVAYFLVDWLVSDKANTLFAFLFGIGFWVQMTRIEARGGPFRAIYLRRLTVLLIFGLIHLFVLWPWEILHLYAMAGFILFAMRRVSNRTLLIAGVALALGGRLITEWVIDVAGISGPAYDLAYSDSAVAARQMAALSGSLVEWSAAMSKLLLLDWFASGLVVAWLLYALGRFLLGALVARLGWIQNAASLLPGYRKWLWRALPLGLAGEAFYAASEAGLILPEGWDMVSDAVHFVSVPLLDTGYVCALVLLFHGGALRQLMAALAAVGRTALSNYVMQSFFILFTFSTVGPGLGLAGTAGSAGSATLLAIAIGGYALQLLLSRLWLGRFAYGPLEWAWRALTYGSAPRMRLAA